ncbi:MAG: exoprotein, partial [Ramlibacter sp.]|nr:exoprotein [Ramlibacter sp.]
DDVLAAQLEFGNVQVTTSGGSSGPNGGSITLMGDADVAWGSGNTLALTADTYIQLDGKLTAVVAAPPPPAVAAVGDTNGVLHLQAGSYIQQNAATSVVRVSEVYAQADTGRISLTGANQMDRFQGLAGTNISVTNATSLTIGQVPTYLGGGGGNAITANGNLNLVTTSGDLRVAPNADISVNGNAVLQGANDVVIDDVSVYGGKLQVLAGRDVRIGARGNLGETSTSLNGNTGLDIEAGRDVVVGNTSFVEVGSSTGLYSGGDLDITAARDIRFRTSSGFSGANTVQGSNGSTRIDAGGDVDFGSSTLVRRTYGSIDVLAGGSILGDGVFQTNGRQGTGADAGSIRLTAEGGSLSFQEVRSHGSFSGVSAGDIQLTAQGDISGGSLYAFGMGASGSTGSGNGGMVTATSSGGGVFFSSIDTQGGSSTDSFGEIRPAGLGGDVLVQAKTDVSGGGIHSSGGDAMSSSATAGPVAKRAGDITVIAGGRIDLSTARADGGSVSAGSAGGGTAGAGGKILLSAGTGVQGGNVSAVGGSADSGSATGGTAGAAGGIQVTTTSGDVSLGSMNAYGGNSFGVTGAGAGGAGGTVQVSAGGDISGYNIDVSGGSGAVGKAAGSIVIKGGGAVGFQGLYASGGFSDSGGQGGRGGLVDVRADGDITLRSYGGPAVSVDGGSSYLGRGGDAGSIVVKSTGGSIVAEQMPASVDGFAAAADGPTPALSANGGHGASGGDGGDITLESKLHIRTDGVQAAGGAALLPGGNGGLGGIANVTFGGTLLTPFIDASGGDGGQGSSSVAAGNGGDGGTVKVARSSGNLVLGNGIQLIARGGNGGDGEAEGLPNAGNGGAGGLVDVSSANAEVILQAPEIHSQGGMGGTNFDGSTGATGTQGVFSAEGTKVQVQGAMQLHSIWVNNADVRMNTGSSVTGGGSFVNFDQVQLADGSALMPSGGVTNHEGARISATGGTSNLNLVDNHGVFDVAAGATVTAPDFSLNEGKVIVDGTLNIGFGVSSGPAVMTVGYLTNAASGHISGSGNLVVAGGAGTVANFGTISPGGAGAVGTLTLTGNLVMESGSTLAIDFGSATSFDKLAVSGSATSGGTVAVNVLGGVEIPAGSYSVVQASSLDAGTMPSVSPTSFEAVASGSELHLVVAAAPEPPPPPASTPAVQNEVVVYSQVFVNQIVKDDDKNTGKDDIVITDTACKP